MRFSVWPSSQQPWDDILDVARHAEATGWDGVYQADHFMPAGGDLSLPMHECWTALAGLAAAVPRIRLGALVSGNTYRHPAVLANMANTADHISGGRIVFGLGAGWQENEHQAYGIELPPLKERMARFREACEIVTRLRDEERVDFDGSYYKLQQAPLEPKPVGPLPLLVGGGGEKVTMRIAAQFADEWNVWGTPDILRHKNKVLDAHCEDLGRDPSTIKRSCQALLFMSDDTEWVAKRRESDVGRAAIVGTPAEVRDTIGEYQDAGVDEIIVPDFTLRPERKKATLDQFIEEVASAFR
jgi:F420-dependent oxidoreductase-like protein